MHTISQNQSVIENDACAGSDLGGDSLGITTPGNNSHNGVDTGAKVNGCNEARCVLLCVISTTHRTVRPEVSP